MAKARILIVEDEAVVAMDIQHTLVHLGYQVIAVVGSGEEAFDQARQLKPDLVLMDIVLRGKTDGIKAAMQIRTQLNIPVVYLTAYADASTLKRAKITEPFGYILKPYHEQELYSTIEMALYKHEADTRIVESERKYKGLVDYALAGVYIIQDNVIKFANQRFAEIFGYRAPDDILGMKIGRLVTPHDKKIVDREFQLRLSGKKMFSNYEIRAIRKEGAVINIEVLGARIMYQGRPAIQGMLLDITARKKVEQALIMSEKSFRFLFERNMAGVYRTTAEGRILDCNEAFVRMFGYTSKEEMLNLPAQALYFDAADRRDFITRLRKTKNLTSNEMRMKRRDGSEAWIIENVNLIKEAGKETEILQGTVIDITDLKMDEKKLHYQADLLENVSDAIISTDLDFNIRTWNKAAEVIYGFKAYEVIDKPVHKVTRLRFIDTDRAKVVKQFFKNGFWHGEVIQRRKDNASLHVLSSVSLIRDNSGRPTGIVAVNRDITKRKEAEAALLKSELKYRTLVEKTGVGIVTTDVKGRFTYVNDELCRLIGYAREELLGKPFARFLHPDDRKWVLKLFWQGFKTPQKKLVIEFRTIHKDGHIINMYSSPTISQFNGRIISFNAIIQDISDRKRAEVEIKRRLEMEKVLTEIAEVLVKAKRIDQAMKKVLACLGHAFDVDVIYLFPTREDGKVWDCSYIWSRRGVKSQHKVLKGIRLNRLGQFAEKLRRNQLIAVSDITGAPARIQKEIRNLRGGEVRAFLALPLFYEAHFFGTIMLYKIKQIREWSDEDIKILKTAGEIMTTTLIKDSIQKQLIETSRALEVERGRMVELARRTIDVQERERLYLASEIHDEMLQGLAAIMYFLQMIDTSRLGSETEERRARLIEIIRASIERGRSLISEIEPIREPEKGLIQAIKKSIDVRFAGTDVRVDFGHPNKMPRIDFAAKINILRIIQEALMNVRKHAGATEVIVRLTVSGSNLILEIGDNGVGFKPEMIAKNSIGHYGLMTMQERSHLIGGKVTISSEPGKGTTIKGSFPIKGAWNG